MDTDGDLSFDELAALRKEFEDEIAAAETEAGRLQLQKQAAKIIRGSVKDSYESGVVIKREELAHPEEVFRTGSVDAFRRPGDEREEGEVEQPSTKRKRDHPTVREEEDEQIVASSSKHPRAASPHITPSLSVGGNGRRASTSDSDSASYRLSDLEIPQWYTEIKMDSMKMRMLNKSKDPKKRQTITALTALKECVHRCETTTSRAVLEKELNALRDHIHKAEFLQPDEYILRKVRMLDNGLKRIFTAPSIFPWDLRADSIQLYRRWSMRIFSIDLLRGIVISKGSKRNADSIAREWNHISPKFNGHGHLIIGQWWPTQLCTVRDGAHGAVQAGIYGEKGCGAYSIVLSGGHGYSDRDEGDTIYYCGTDSKDHVPTEATTRMLESVELQLPVRVIRSWNLKKPNPYRPERGFRYDGLYMVVESTILDPLKAMYNFKLERCPGQDPIRYEGAVRRPTDWEIAEYDRLREMGRGI